jgi:hypothetical protein
MSNQLDTMDAIEQYLRPFREKVAMDTSFVAKDKQTNLGLEQSKAAKASGSTIEDEKDNNRSMGDKPTDDQGTKTLYVDDKVTQGNIGNIVKEEIGQVQKTAAEQARITKVANSLVNTLMGMQKQASVEKQYTELEKVAIQKGNDYALSFLAGFAARQRDEEGFQKNASLAPLIQQAGGIGNLLDKIAMETPEDILPVDALPPEAAAPEALPPEAAAAPAEGGAPSEAELEQISNILAESGATPEDLQEAVAIIEELKAQGATEEDLAQALSEINAEGVSAPAEGEVQKTAAEQKRNNVNAIKSILKNSLS